MRQQSDRISENEVLMRMYNIIRMKKEVDRWQELNKLSIEWLGDDEE